MTSHEHPSLRALDEIEDLLEAYAEARLSPSSPMLARMRRTVITEAAAVAAVRAADRRLAEADTPRERRSWLPTFRLPRPVFAAGFAALLTVSTGAAVLAAPPGSAFFNARVALETIFLPTQPDERLASHEQHLEARLAEAEAAAARGDAVALAAALAAYDAEVGRAVAEMGNDGNLLAHLEAMLAKHVGVLTALEAKVPAQSSVDDAIENSEKAIEKVKEKAKAGKPANPGGGRPAAPGGRP